MSLRGAAAWRRAAAWRGGSASRGAGAWRAGIALAEGDLRRRRNRLPGFVNLSPALRTAVTIAAAVAALTVAAMLWGIGTALGDVVPVTALQPVAAACWLGAGGIVAAQLLAVRPAQARLLLDPADRGVLLPWDVPPATVFTARLVLPALAGAVGLVAAVAVLAVPWLAATSEGRSVLPAVVLTATGAALTGAAAQVCATAALMTTARDAGAARWTVSATVIGLGAGYFVSPLVSSVVAARGTSAEVLTATLRHGTAAARPRLWDELFAHGGLPAVAAFWALLVLVLSCAAALLLRVAARRSTLLPTTPGTGPDIVPEPRPTGRPPAGTRWSAAVLRRTTPAVLRRATPADGPSGLVPALVAKDLLALRRRPAAVTHPLYRLCAAGVGLAALGIGIRLRHGSDLPWSVASGSWGTAAALALFLMVSTVVAQVCGVEAEGRSLDTLLQAPVPFGAVLVAKVCACACVAALPTVPAYLGLLAGFGGGFAPAALLALPVALLGGSAATVVTAFLAPPAEQFTGERAVRSGAAETAEGLLAAVLVAPAASGLLLRQVLDLSPAATTAANTAACLLTLSLYAVCLRLLARRDVRFPKAAL
ncbi:hypothetical protein AB0C51_09740 [Streptomyces pathocidini]|uniref:hypothetical protein n=1 Tax=Streptomyces pathocidini TaxID=1650571 RepID=UPI003409863C